MLREKALWCIYIKGIHSHQLLGHTIFMKILWRLSVFFLYRDLTPFFFHLTSSSSRCIKQFFLNIFPLNKLKWSNNVCSRRVIHARFLDLLFFFISSFFSFFSQVVCTSWAFLLLYTTFFFFLSFIIFTLWIYFIFFFFILDSANFYTLYKKFSISNCLT